MNQARSLRLLPEIASSDEVQVGKCAETPDILYPQKARSKESSAELARLWVASLGG